MTDIEDTLEGISTVDLAKIIEKKASKFKTKCRVMRVVAYCNACGKEFLLTHKDDGMFTLPQQICPHVTIRKIELK